MIWQQEPRYPWMVQMVLKTGLGQTRKQAEVVLLLFAGLCIVITLWILFPDDTPALRPEEDPDFELPAVAGR